MTVPVFPRNIANISYSLHKWFQGQQYKISDTDTPGTLFDHYSDLVIVPAYPGDLTAIQQTTLAICSPETIREGQSYYGGAILEDRYVIAFYGFVAGFGVNNGAALLRRDSLMNDLYLLLRQLGEGEGVPLYDTSDTAMGTFELSSVRSRVLPANAPAIEADRFKFVVEAEIQLVMDAS